MIRLTAQQITLDASAEGEPSRQITGLAVPWNVKATLSGGESVIFLEGSLPEDGPMPKLLEFHDDTRVIGRVTERVSTSEGLLFVAKLSATRAADDALALLADGALDSVSVGAVPTKFKRLSDGTLEVSQAKFVELSVVTVPAYESAQVYSVAASSPDEEAPDEEETPTPTPSEEDEMSEAIEAAVFTAPIYAAARREVKIPTAAEYIVAAAAGGDAWHKMREAIRAAAPDVTTADTAGLLPEILVQPVYNNFVGSRPVIDAIGPRAIPTQGSTFRLPYVSTHASIGAQSAENATLTAATFVVSAYDVSKVTYGGYATVSEQDLDWSSPEVVGLLLDDMARIYAFQTDNAVADALLAAVTQSAVLTDPTSPAEWVSDVADACVTILNNSNGNKATHLFLSPNMYGSLSKLVDTTGRPLFSSYGPMNALGATQVNTFEGMAFGLRVVVDRNFAADTVIVADPTGYFVGEAQKGAISIDVPSTLSRTIAFRGYLAQKMVDATKFVKLT